MYVVHSGLRFEPSFMGWEAALPESLGTLDGMAVRLDVDTGWTGPDSGEPPVFSERQLRLADLIVSNFSHLMDAAFKELVQWHERGGIDFEEARSSLEDPRISISDDVDCSSPSSWSLVVSLSSFPDFGYHIEFLDLDPSELWTGT